MSRTFHTLRNRLLKKRPKTFLQQIKTSLVLGNIFGCISFSIEETSAWNIVLSLPIQVLYIACILNFIKFLNVASYNNTKVLYTSDLLYLIITSGFTLIQPFYYLINRRQHRKLYLRIQHINNLLNLEEKMYFEINFHFILFLFFLMGMNTGFLIMVYEATDIRNFGHYVTRCLVYTVFCVNEYIQYIILKEIRNQYIVINMRIKQIEDTKTETIRNLIDVSDKVANSTLNVNSFLNFSVLSNIGCNVFTLIWMCDFLFVSLSKLFNGEVINQRLAFISFIRIVTTLVYIQLKIRNWVHILNEVRVFHDTHFQN